MTLIGLIRETAKECANKTALICGETRVTFAELDSATGNIARWFLRSGLVPGDRVVIHGTNTIQTAQLLLACFRAGMIAVPVNMRLKAAEIAYILEHAEAKMCFSQPEIAHAMEEAGASNLHIGIPAEAVTGSTDAFELA